MEKVKFLKQSSVVFLLSLSLLVGCKGGEDKSERMNTSPTPGVTRPSATPTPSPLGIDSPQKSFKGTQAEYNKLKTQAKDDWGKFKTAFENFQTQYLKAIDPQLKNAIPKPKGTPSSDPPPPTLTVDQTIEIENTLKRVRIAYDNFIKNNVTSTKSVLTEEVKQQILAIGGDPATESQQEDAKNQSPLKQIERVLWPLKKGLELTADQDTITDPTGKQELEKERITEIKKVQKIVQASPLDGLYGQGTYDKIKSYLKQQFTDINGNNNTNIDSLEKAIITQDTAFLLPPREEPSHFPWWLLWIGGVIVVLLLARKFDIVPYLNRKRGTAGSGGATTEPQPKSLPQKQLSDDDSAVLFTAIGHALNQIGIETNIDKQGLTLEALVDLLNEEIIKQEIIKIVQSDLLRNESTNSLDSQIVQRVVDSHCLNQKISLLKTHLEQEIRNIIREELQRGDDRWVEEQGAIIPNQQQRVDDQPSATTQNHQSHDICSRSQLSQFIEKWCIIYNDQQKQLDGQVAQEFRQKATELEETQESNTRRSYNFSAPQHIELQTVSKNKGSFWLVRTEENSQDWLFPKINIKSADHQAVKDLFEIVEGDLSNYRNIEVIEPAEMMSSDTKIWKLKKKGKIRLDVSDRKNLDKRQFVSRKW